MPHEEVYTVHLEADLGQGERSELMNLIHAGPRGGLLMTGLHHSKRPSQKKAHDGVGRAETYGLGARVHSHCQVASLLS